MNKINKNGWKSKFLSIIVILAVLISGLSACVLSVSADSYSACGGWGSKNWKFAGYEVGIVTFFSLHIGGRAIRSILSSSDDYTPEFMFESTDGTSSGVMEYESVGVKAAWNACMGKVGHGYNLVSGDVGPGFHVNAYLMKKWVPDDGGNGSSLPSSSSAVTVKTLHTADFGDVSVMILPENVENVEISLDEEYETISDEEFILTAPEATSLEESYDPITGKLNFNPYKEILKDNMKIDQAVFIEDNSRLYKDDSSSPDMGAMEYENPGDPDQTSPGEGSSGPVTCSIEYHLFSMNSGVSINSMEVVSHTDRCFIGKGKISFTADPEKLKANMVKRYEGGECGVGSLMAQKMHTYNVDTRYYSQGMHSTRVNLLLAGRLSFNIMSFYSVPQSRMTGYQGFTYVSNDIDVYNDFIPYNNLESYDIDDIYNQMPIVDQIVENVGPNQIANFYPTGGQKTDIKPILRWFGGDPNADDSVSYQIYLGTSEDPQLKELIGPFDSEQVLMTYDPGTLKEGTTYYWKVAARDENGNVVEGPVAKFTTRSLQQDPTDPDPGDDPDDPDDPEGPNDDFKSILSQLLKRDISLAQAVKKMLSLILKPS